jgi:alanine racemase
LSWKARVLSVKTVPAGWSIGYGGIFQAPRPMRIGIVAVGYADGLPHRLSNRGQVIAAGRAVPILGAVSMDLTTIDLSDCPEIRPGDAITLIGTEGQAGQDAQQLARLAGTISYDVLCGIRARVKRVYV